LTVLIAEENDEARKQISDTVSKLRPEAELLCFGSSLAALAMARKREVDTAFLSTGMRELNGLILGSYLADLNPYINLIFLSDGPEYGYAAISRHASGYIINPPTEESVRRELDDLRHPDIQKREKRVFVQTFGNFDLFADGRPVAFKYSKTKEMVALLVNNRGARTTNGEIIAALWEDDGDPEKKGSYLSNLRQDLQNTLTRLKLNGIIIKQRGSLAIVPDRIECDLYDWLEKKQDSAYRYMGDYMNQYSWSEYMHAELDEISYAMEET
jgi:two-component SAPR family response regulator